MTPLPAWRHGPVTLAADTRVMTRRGPGGAHWAETGPGAQSVVSESHREREGGTETAATSRGVSRLTWPGLVPRCPAPVSRSSHALCPGPDSPAQLRPCSDPRTRPFQIVQTRATHSVRLSLGPTPVLSQSLGPNRPGCGPDDGADGQRRPGCHGTGPGPYLLRPLLCP